MKCDFWGVWDKQGPDAVKRAVATAKSPDIATVQQRAQNATAAVLESRDWPEPLAPEASCGLAGAIVTRRDPRRWIAIAEGCYDGIELLRALEKRDAASSQGETR
jgi:hypothetical protein